METLLHHIFQLYELRLEFAEKVTKGFLSENYILADSSAKYFLKKYRFADQARIAEIHQVKRYFSVGGIPVILPLSAKNGNTFFSFESAWYALFPFVNGKHPERSGFTAQEIESLGETLARLHRLGKLSPLCIGAQCKPWSKTESLATIAHIEEEIRKRSSLNDFDTLALESLALKQRLISSSTLVYEDLRLPNDHLVHGDYLDNNVFFGEHRAVSHVFDFEKTEYAPRTHELFRSMFYIFGDDGLPQGLVRAKKYLDAYAETYPIPKEEIQNGLKLFYLKSIHGAWVESEHYLKNNTRVDCFLYPDFMRIKFLSENLSAVEDLLMQ
ncbi:MAG: phosphotransferase [Parcubacteria group bacterium]|nr:phosphotransferase [Parcubacteria group bacterium]